MQLQSITSTGMYSQTSKSAFDEFFSAQWDKKSFVQNSWDTSQVYIFSIPETFENTNLPPFKIFFCETKSFRYLFLWSPLPSMVYRKFPARQLVTVRNFQTQPEFFTDKKVHAKTWYLLCIKFFNTKNFQKHQRVPLLIFSLVGQKNFDYFLWYGLIKILHLIVDSSDF